MMGATRKYFAAALALLVVGLFIWHLAVADAGDMSEAETIGSGRISFQELSDRFTELAKEKGGVYAFDVLRIAKLPPNTDTHLLGHAVGDVLYSQQGIDGIAKCTQDFRNACSHAIVIGALNEFGPGDATIDKIHSACHEAPGGEGAYTMCFHGLGHGVFAYFGYDMPKSVSFCKRLGTPEYDDQEYTQCVGGMIMELVDGGGHDHDEWAIAHDTYLDPTDPLAPCDRTLIPTDAKSFCYIYLTPHLFEAAGAHLSNPDPSTFSKAMSYCDSITDSRLRDTCYGSFGKEFIPLAASRDIRRIDQMSDDEYATAISWCMLGGTTHAKDACIGQAVGSVFWGGENDPQASFRLCSLVNDTSAQAACYADLGQNIASYTTGTTRTALCAQLPMKDQNKCENVDVASQDKP